MNRTRRGAALPETAFVLTVMLALLVGALRVGLVGYAQITADGAAFYNSRLNALVKTDPSVSTSINPDSATHTAFPSAAKQTVASTTYAPPPADVNTNYGLTATGDRRGGASLIQPQQTISTSTNTNLDALTLFNGGSVLTVQGIGVDATYKETGIHGGIAGDAFNSTGSFAAAGDYFTQGENTPPYFGGFHYMRFCNVANSSTPWNYCPVSAAYLALGMAEYLDKDNWSRTVNGVLPQQTAVFWETLFHQQAYACLSRYLPATISGGNQAFAQALLDHITGSAAPIYKWDSLVAGGFPPVGYTPGDYPLNPGAGAPVPAC